MMYTEIKNHLNNKYYDNTRFKMVEEAIGRKAVEVKAPADVRQEYFGKYVFDRDKMRKYLPKACFETLMNTMKNGSPLDRETADCVAARNETVGSGIWELLTIRIGFNP